MTYDKLDALGQLLGCYFHQDWLDEFESDEVAIQSIVDAEPQEQIRAGIEEIDLLLAASLSESELRVLLTERMGCYFEPVSKGITYDQWLRCIRQKFLLSPDS
jgi:hypothetical protein